MEPTTIRTEEFAPIPSPPLKKRIRTTKNTSSTSPPKKRARTAKNTASTTNQIQDKKRTASSRRKTPESHSEPNISESRLFKAIAGTPGELVRQQRVTRGGFTSEQVKDYGKKPTTPTTRRNKKK